MIAGTRCAVCGASVEHRDPTRLALPASDRRRPVPRPPSGRTRPRSRAPGRREPVRAVRPPPGVVGVRPRPRHDRDGLCRTDPRGRTRLHDHPVRALGGPLRRARGQCLGQGRDRERRRFAQGASPRRHPAPPQGRRDARTADGASAAGDRVVRERGARCCDPRGRRRLADRRLRTDVDGRCVRPSPRRARSAYTRL